MDKLGLQNYKVKLYNLDMIIFIGYRVKSPRDIIFRRWANKDYNYSAPHGAGRVLSRKKAFETISLSDYIQVMEGIYLTTVTKEILDEAPFAYKNIKDILDNIVATVEVIEIIKPIYNFKATE